MSQHSNSYKKLVTKDWGYEEICVNNERYCGKFLNLKKGFQCSIHYHAIKDETFYLMEGKVLLMLFDVSGGGIVVPREYIYMRPGSTARIFPKVPHKFIGVIDSKILEVSTRDDAVDSYRLSRSGRVSEDEFKRISKDFAD